jgi:c(7)-type cytochrome triheme protein
VKTGSAEIDRLLAAPKDATPFPIRPAYTVADFVLFSHARHQKAEIGCQECHGDVTAQDTVTVLVPVTMKTCVACHKTRRASITCNTCHQLGQ